VWYLAFYGILAIWVCADALHRKAKAIAWTVGTLFLGPVVVPVYLAKRPLKAGEVREGGIAWNVLKNFALFWTLLVAVAAVRGMMAVSERTATLQSDAEKIGAAIGTTLGLGFIAAVWFFPVVGAAALGFMLKKSSVVERGPTGPLASPTDMSSDRTKRLASSVASVAGPGTRCPQCGLIQMRHSICKSCGTSLSG